ncbi:MAG: superoxide dismutase family protein [Clostridia bacterium]|nr:superoxide dismutase family protein [Clostridia bacterium]
MLYNNFSKILKKKPTAVAYINGSPDYTQIKGIAAFYQLQTGVIVAVQISGLPQQQDICKKPIFAMHIHSGGSCTGNETDYFADALTHYNPNDCNHPYHSGDLPPLFGVKGRAFSTFLSDRFTVREIIGKTIIIHSNPDDFTTQPSGNSGTKIACGVIKGTSVRF